MRMDPQTRTGWLQALEKQGKFSPEAHHSRGEAAGMRAMIGTNGGVPNLTQVLKDGGKEFKGDPEGLQGFYAGVEAHKKMFPSSDVLNKKDTLTVVGNMRSNFAGLQDVKDFKKIAPAFLKMQAAVKSKTAAGDMSLVFNFMKMLDPGSTVREGEYASAKNTTGVPGRVINAYNSLIDGEFLSDAQRSGFMAEARSSLAAHKQTVLPSIRQYQGLAKMMGVPETSIIPPGLFDIKSNTTPGEEKHPGLGGGDNLVPLGKTEAGLEAERKRLAQVEALKKEVAELNRQLEESR